MDEPKSPNCPMCDQPPFMVMGGGTQAFCGTREGCPVMTWNPMNSRAEFFRTAQQIEIEPGGEGEPSPEGREANVIPEDDGTPPWEPTAAKGNETT